jgi:hypothetical protein
MTPRVKMPKPGSSAFTAAIAFSIALCAGTPGAYAGGPVVTETSGDFIPGSDRASIRLPATFFTINPVLAKLDRQRLTDQVPFVLRP